MKNLHSARWLIAPALFLAFCSKGNAPTISGPSSLPGPSATVTAGGSVGISADGDVKVGTGTLDFLNLSIWGFNGDPGAGGFVNPGGSYGISAGVEVKLWATYVEGSPANPKFMVDWGDGTEPSAGGCGACKAIHTYAIPGLYTVKASLDDRVSTMVTRTFALDARPEPVAAAPVAAEIILRPGPDDGKDAYAWSCGGAHDGAGVAIAGSPRSYCNQCNNKAYIQFDLSTLPEVATKAYLGFTHLPHTTYCYSNCSANFYFYPVLQAWDEMTVGSGAMPSEGTPFFGPVPIGFPNDFGAQEYDITVMYNNWKANNPANNGLAIYSPEGSCNNASVGFHVYSSDDPTPSNRPYLRIVR